MNDERVPRWEVFAPIQPLKDMSSEYQAVVREAFDHGVVPVRCLPIEDVREMYGLTDDPS